MRERQIFTVLFVSVMVLSAVVGSAYGKVPLGWGVERIRAYCVWDNDNWNMTNPWDVDTGANAGQNITIAVIDSGVDYYVDDWGNKVYHPDLAPNIAGGMGFSYYPPWNGSVHLLPNDYQDNEEPAHGTQVIGVISAIVNGIGANSSGIIGAAPKTHIYVLKLFSRLAPEYVAAINYSVDTIGAKIINISAGKNVSYPVVETACDYAYSKGALIFASSGNDNTTIDYPAAYDSVVAVGASDKNDSRWYLSNYGPKLNFVAPGFDIPTTSMNEGYEMHANGTSIATPYASATAALIWGSKLDPNFDFNGNGIWDRDEVLAKMNSTALCLNPQGPDNYTGLGLINAWKSNQRPLGDINLDMSCDVLDFYAVCHAYNSSPGDSNWDPRCDINIDKIVDVADYYVVCQHYGETDP